MPPSTPIWALVRCLCECLVNVSRICLDSHSLLFVFLLTLYSTSFLISPSSNLYVMSHSPLSNLCFLPQSSQGEMTWSLWATFSCTLTWVLCPGRGSRLPPRGRSMNASVRRKCPPPLRCSARDTHVSMEKNTYLWSRKSSLNRKNSVTFLSKISASHLSSLKIHFSLCLVFFSWVLHLPEFVSFPAFWWQARLLIS